MEMIDAVGIYPATEFVDRFCLCLHFRNHHYLVLLPFTEHETARGLLYKYLLICHRFLLAQEANHHNAYKINYV